jgi:hypothetical protein
VREPPPLPSSQSAGIGGTVNIFFWCHPFPVRGGRTLIIIIIINTYHLIIFILFFSFAY